MRSVDMSSGIRLSLVHCAFCGCKWTKDFSRATDTEGILSRSTSWQVNGLRQWSLEWALFVHFKHHHKDAIRFLFEQYEHLKPKSKSDLGRHDCMSEYDLFLSVISDYVAAVSEKEREGMPTVGISKDRHMLRGLNYILDGVSAQICFGCAQKQTHVPLWDLMHTPGQHGLHYCEDGSRWSEHTFAQTKHSNISMYTIEKSLERFKNRNERRIFAAFLLREIQAAICI